MATLALALGGWLLVSLPLGVAVGKAFAARDRQRPAGREEEGWKP